MKVESQGRTAGSGCLILFSLPFIGVGVFMSWLISSDISDYLAMRAWVPTPMTILQADLDESTDSEGSTTYEVWANYSYTFQSAQFQGARVGISGGADNIGSYHQDMAEQLQRYAASGEPWTGYVNPDQPSEAVLDRELRWGKLGFFFVFIATFGGAGVGMLAGGFWSRRKGKAAQQLRAAEPDRPWEWRPEWSGGRIAGSGPATAWFLTGFAALWNLISLPAAVIVLSEFFRGEIDYIALLVLLFPLVGVGLLLGAVTQWMRWGKFGRIYLELATMPAVSGGALSGLVRLTRQTQLMADCRVTLTCNRRERRGKETKTILVWQDAQSVTADQLLREPGATLIPVLFEVPYDMPITDDEGNERVEWKLRVQAELPGFDLDEQFEVPVFRTDASDPNLTAQLLESSPIAEAPELRDAALRAAGATYTVRSGEAELYFPMGRQIGTTIFLALFSLVFIGVGVGIPQAGAPIWFGGIFAVVGALLLYGAFYLLFATVRVTLRPGQVIVQSGLFGLGTPRTVSLAEIKEIDLHSSMQSGDLQYFDVLLVLFDDKRLKAGTRIPGLDRARSIKQIIERALYDGEVGR